MNVVSNMLTFAYDSAEELKVKNDGHYHIHVPTFYAFGNIRYKLIDYIFDTGAFITVLTREEAAVLGFADKFTIQKNVPLGGFAGGCLADIKDIPGMVMGGHHLEGVKVAVPQVHIDANILGLNVIEQFKFYYDSQSDMIYFAENPSPTIEEPLRCGKVRIITPDVKSKLW